MQRVFSPCALPRRHILVTTVAAASVISFGCSEETASFVASARVIPESLSLNFGDVSVNERKTLPITFESDGSSPYQIVALNLSGDPDAFEFEPSAELVGDGVRPGQSSTVAVTYVPCPDAWTGDPPRLRSGFDFATCPDSLITADLNITDNTPSQSVRVTLSGSPVQPPQATLRCPAVSAACGEENPSLGTCSFLRFGAVDASANQPCDLIVEVTNAWRDGSAVGPLLIEDIEIQVENVDTDQITSGAEAGFTVLDINREPLSPTADNPVTVQIEPGSQEGTYRFWVRYTGAVPGTWSGSRDNETGLRLSTNVPEERVLSAPISAVGTAPDVSVFPPFHNFEEVAQGDTSSVALSVRNDGNAVLSVTNIAIRSGNPEFTWTTSRGENFPIEVTGTAGDRAFDLEVTYAPADAGFDVEFLEVFSNDPDENPFVVELRGGATPRIEVNPSDILVYEVENPPLPETDRDVIICNVGEAELTVSQFDLEPAVEGGGALDDFQIVVPSSCSTLPCNVDIRLCPPEADGCDSSCTTATVRYKNNDQSSVDEVNLLITSNDPGDMVHRLVLRANDVPCRFPRPVIRVITPNPCAGRIVQVTAEDSDPGGRLGQNDTIVADSYQWNWLFARRPAPTFMPTNQVDMTFLPTRGGQFILGLDVQNTCGQVSQTSATEQIPIRDSCE